MNGNKLLGSLFILGLIISQASLASAAKPSCGTVGVSLSPPTASYAHNNIMSVFSTPRRNNVPNFFAVVTKAKTNLNYKVLRARQLRSSVNGNFVPDEHFCTPGTIPSCTSRGAITLSNGRGGAGYRELAGFGSGFYKIQISKADDSCSPTTSPEFQIRETDEGVPLILRGSNAWRVLAPSTSPQSFVPAFATETSAGKYLFWSGVVKNSDGTTSEYNLGEYNLMAQPNAVNYCEGLGGGARLPTKDEYIALSRAMGSRQPLMATDINNPRTDFSLNGYQRNLMPDLTPDMNDAYFWSASPEPVNASLGLNGAFYFSGGTGHVYMDAGHSPFFVRCVR